MNTISERIKKFIEKIGKRNFLILCSAVVIVLIFIIIIVSIILKKAQGEPTYAATYQHDYLINYTAGETVSRQIKEDIKSTTFNKDDIKTAPNKNSVKQPYDGYLFYDITFIEDSFKTRSDLPEKSYQVNVKISDDRTYNAYYRLDKNYGNNYYVLILDRTDKPESADYIYIHTNDNKNIQPLKEWATSNFSLNNPKIITKSLDVAQGNQN